MKRHGHLTVTRLAQRPRVLALDPRRVLTVLNEPGVVQHPRPYIDRPTDPLGHRARHQRRIPRAVGQELLQALTTARSEGDDGSLPALLGHLALTEFWAGGRSRAWILFQTSLLHVYGHYFEGLATKGLWGARSR